MPARAGERAANSETQYNRAVYVYTYGLRNVGALRQHANRTPPTGLRQEVGHRRHRPDGNHDEKYLKIRQFDVRKDPVIRGFERTGHVLGVPVREYLHQVFQKYRGTQCRHLGIPPMPAKWADGQPLYQQTGGDRDEDPRGRGQPEMVEAEIIDKEQSIGTDHQYGAMRQIEDIHRAENQIEADGYDCIECARGDADKEQFRYVGSHLALARC